MYRVTSHIMPHVTHDIKVLCHIKCHVTRYYLDYFHVSGTYSMWGAALAGGDVLIPESTQEWSQQYAKALGWTLVKGF